MKNGTLRIFLINFLCFLTIAAFFIKFLKIPSTATAPGEEFFNFPAAFNNPKDEVSKNTPTEETENKKGNTTSTVSKTEKPVSAAAIKGNIISQYNSPYTAALSYDGVYIKNNTSLKINVKEFLEAKINFKIKKNDQPQVLILHTHATETFMTENTDYFTENFTSRSRDDSKNMIAVGKIVSKKLNDAGIKTLHATIQHDYPSYTKSYSRAAETINEYLKKYPSIKVVLDLHRDAVSKENGDKVKLVTEINGKKAAQVMIVMGSQSGSVTNFPKWKENFKLAVRLHRQIEKNYPTLARPIMLMSKNYNESLTTGSLLIEFGTDVNTLEEALYSAEMVGESIVKTLEELT